MPPRDLPDPLSKRSLKKQQKQSSKKQAKLDHQSKVHESMLESAKLLRHALQRGSTSIPDELLYDRLSYSGVGELFAGIDDQVIRSSPLFCGTANSWKASERDDNSLPQARSCQLIDQFLWRPHKYNEKYASQELSLLYQLFRLGGKDCDLVLDVGGGNANLSCLIALVFDVPVVCVEMESPREELRGEAWLPEPLKGRGAVTRVESLIQDYTLPPGYSRVLVLGKHLCGPGTDAAIEFAATHRERVLGCVFATCCCCKLVGGTGTHGSGTDLFADLYFGRVDGVDVCAPCDDAEEPCPPDSRAERSEAEAEGACAGSAVEMGAAPAWTGLVGAAAKRLAAAVSVGAGEAEGEYLRRVLPEVARCTSWRNQVHNVSQHDKFSAISACAVARRVPPRPASLLPCVRRANVPPPPPRPAHAPQERCAQKRAYSSSALARGRSHFPLLPIRNRPHNLHPILRTGSYPQMLDQATYFESWIQGFRRRKLRALFDTEEELLYCNDSSHSQQNRCIVSGKQLALSGSDESRGRGAFFEQLERQFARYKSVLPVDLRARGLVSSRFGHDGTVL